MSDYVQKLEMYDDLDATLVASTKINKVLKGVVKLASIPKEEEYHLRQRSHDLLQKWNHLFVAEPETPTAATSAAREDADINGTDPVEKDDDDQVNGKKTKDENDAAEVQIAKDEVKDEEMAEAKGDEVEPVTAAEEEVKPAEAADDDAVADEKVEKSTTKEMQPTVTEEADEKTVNEVKTIA